MIKQINLVFDSTAYSISKYCFKCTCYR